MTLSCVKFTDLEQGTCGAAVPGGNTRFVGTLFDFITKEPLANTEIRIVATLTALMDPMAVGLVTATSGADGKIDAASMMPLNAAFGVVGLVGDGATLYITATNLAAPAEGGEYPPLNDDHDIWAVPTASLAEWSNYLTTDAEPLYAYLPLGEKGGIIGLVRDNTGAPVAGAVVKSTKADSSAIVRFLEEDNVWFNADATGSSGIFVIMNPGLAENFTVNVGGQPTSLNGTAGSAEGAVFVLIFSVP